MAQTVKPEGTMLDAHGPSGKSRRSRAPRPTRWSLNVETIERERMLRGWTQRQLARNARVDPGTLSDLLGQRRRPTFGTVQAICTSLVLTLPDVMVFESNDGRRGVEEAGGPTRFPELAEERGAAADHESMIAQRAAELGERRREQRRAWARGASAADRLH